MTDGLGLYQELTALLDELDRDVADLMPTGRKLAEAERADAGKPLGFADATGECRRGKWIGRRRCDGRDRIGRSERQGDVERSADFLRTLTRAESSHTDDGVQQLEEGPVVRVGIVGEQGGIDDVVSVRKDEEHEPGVDFVTEDVDDVSFHAHDPVKDPAGVDFRGAGRHYGACASVSGARCFGLLRGENNAI